MLLRRHKVDRCNVVPLFNGLSAARSKLRSACNSVYNFKPVCRFQLTELKWYNYAYLYVLLGQGSSQGGANGALAPSPDN